jgi:hypothetical protein
MSSRNRRVSTRNAEIPTQILNRFKRNNNRFFNVEKVKDDPSKSLQPLSAMFAPSSAMAATMLFPTPPFPCSDMLVNYRGVASISV